MKNTYLLICTALLFLTSCSDFFEKEIEFDLPANGPQLATSAVFRTDTTLKRIFVSNTIPVLDRFNSKGFEDLSDTEVMLSDGTHSVFFDYDQSFDTTWHGRDKEHMHVRPNPYNFSYEDHYPLIEGKEYTLSVTREGFETAIAKCLVEPQIELDNFSLNKIGENEYSILYNLRMTLKKLPSSEKFYKIKIVPGSLKNRYTQFHQDDFSISFTPSLERNAILINSELFDKKTKSLSITIRSNHSFSEKKLSVKIYAASISEERVEYEKKVNVLLEADDNPFLSPLIVPTNFEGGLGNFSIENGKVYIVVEE